MKPETRNHEVIIVGAGIAGASAAFALSNEADVLIVEAEEPGAGASGVAGGLFSPMIALRGRPVWRIDEAIEAFNEQLKATDAIDMFDDRGVLRPARNIEQVEYFRQSVERCPNHAAWLSPGECAERFPLVEAPLGAMMATSGGALSLMDYTRRLVEAASNRGAHLLTHTRVTSWGENEGCVFVDVKRGEAEDRIYAHQLILAGGRMFFDHPDLAGLDLHAVKGQTIRLAYPPSMNPRTLLPISGAGYVIPETSTLAVGSSFEHQFEHDGIEKHVSHTLHENAASMIPTLSDAEILEEHVGIRVTVPKIRLPMVGPLPGSSRIWVFTAFGSKGLLLAPLLSSELPGFIRDPTRIPNEVRVRMG